MSSTSTAPKLLFVGAFPPPGANVAGGNVTDCRALLSSSFSRLFELVLVDSTQLESPVPALPKRARAAARRISRFRHLLNTARPDAALIFASSGFSFLEKSALAALAERQGVPTLLSIRSGHFMDQCRSSALFRQTARLLLRTSTRLLCQGEQWRRFFIDEMGVSPERCTIVENWVASSELLAIGQRRSTGTSRVPRILFLGAIEKFKGIYELLTSATMLRSRGAPEFVLSIAGNGSELSAVQRWIRKNELEGVVRLEGLVAGEDKLRLLEQSDIFVLPSHTEGLPNAMVEAMAAALPVIVTPVGSVPDVVENGVNGILVPARDPAALADKLEELLRSPALRSTLGEAGRASAAARFGTEPAANALSAVIRELQGE